MPTLVVFAPPHTPTQHSVSQITFTYLAPTCVGWAELESAPRVSHRHRHSSHSLFANCCHCTLCLVAMSPLCTAAARGAQLQRSAQRRSKRVGTALRTDLLERGWVVQRAGSQGEEPPAARTACAPWSSPPELPQLC